MHKNKEIKNYDPFETMLSFRDNFDRMFKDILRGFSTPAYRRGVLPVMDIKETSLKYIIEVEIPGIKKEDIKLSIKKNELILEGEKREEKKKKGESYIRVERTYGNFRRHIRLPIETVQSEIKADYNNGILTIILPKKEKHKPKEIEVKID